MQEMSDTAEDNAYEGPNSFDEKETTKKKKV